MEGGGGRGARDHICPDWQTPCNDPAALKSRETTVTVTGMKAERLQAPVARERAGRGLHPHPPCRSSPLLSYQDIEHVKIYEAGPCGKLISYRH